MDYLGLTYLDKSDGTSLRRFIEKTNYNEESDNEVVVGERDARYPKKDGLTKKLGKEVNFMIRKGDYKLMLPKKANSPLLDMMYDLGSDPYEMKNLLGEKGRKASKSVIGKAEHLKIVSHIIIDAGHTEIPAGTKTVLGIGPAPNNIVDQITGALPLL